MKVTTTLTLGALSLPVLATAIPQATSTIPSTSKTSSSTTTSTMTVLHASTTLGSITSLDGSVMVRINLENGDTFWVPRSIVTGFNAAPSVSAYIASYLATASPNATAILTETEAKVIAETETETTTNKAGVTYTTTLTTTSTVSSTTTITATASGGFYTLGYASGTYTVPASVATGVDAANAIDSYIAGLDSSSAASATASG